MEKRKINKKKILFVCGITVAAVLAILLIAALIVLLLPEKKIATRVVDPDIKFADAIYSYNIFDDPIYVAKQRNIYYLEYSSGTLIGADYFGDDRFHGIAPESEYKKYGEEALFFRNYFLCLINGDYENYKTFFTDNFFKYYTIPEKFTMQKIYDITVNLYDRQAITDDGSETLARYIVSYKIMNNNGTFRGDMASDTEKALYIKLHIKDGTVLIDSISFITDKKAG